jgi:LPS O-antigen subunit length determinant protein (WzzB/FepE family)
MIAAQSTNKARAVIIQVNQLAKNDASRSFRQVADDWRNGCIDGAKETWKGQIENVKYAINSANGQDIAELHCQITSAKRTMYVYSKAWLAKGRMISYLACSRISRPDEDKEITDIFASVHVSDPN